MSTAGRYSIINLPRATRTDVLPNWDRCAVAGCLRTRVLGRQGCSEHPHVERETCHRVNAIPEQPRGLREVAMEYLKLTVGTIAILASLAPAGCSVDRAALESRNQPDATALPDGSAEVAPPIFQNPLRSHSPLPSRSWRWAG